MPDVVQSLKSLREIRAFDALRSAVLELSQPRGPVKSCTVSFDDSTRTVFCFLEMRWPLADSEVREVGAVGFGSGLVLEFPVPPDFRGRSGTWSA
jgi:hypothetical protein